MFFKFRVGREMQPSGASPPLGCVSDFYTCSMAVRCIECVTEYQRYMIHFYCQNVTCLAGRLGCQLVFWCLNVCKNLKESSWMYKYLSISVKLRNKITLRPFHRTVEVTILLWIKEL